MKQILKIILAKFKFAPEKYVMGIVKYRENTAFPLHQFPEMTTAHNPRSWCICVFILSVHTFRHPPVY